MTQPRTRERDGESRQFPSHDRYQTRVRVVVAVPPIYNKGPDSREGSGGNERVIADAALTACLLRFSRALAEKGCLIRPEFFLCLPYGVSKVPYPSLSLALRDWFLSTSCASEMQREGASFSHHAAAPVDQKCKVARPPPLFRKLAAAESSEGLRSTPYFAGIVLGVQYCPYSVLYIAIAKGCQNHSILEDTLPSQPLARSAGTLLAVRMPRALASRASFSTPRPSIPASSS